jgi:hypothetical protein
MLFTEPTDVPPNFITFIFLCNLSCLMVPFNNQGLLHWRCKGNEKCKNAEIIKNKNAARSRIFTFFNFYFLFIDKGIS